MSSDRAPAIGTIRTETPDMVALRLPVLVPVVTRNVLGRKVITHANGMVRITAYRQTGQIFLGVDDPAEESACNGEIVGA